MSDLPDTAQRYIAEQKLREERQMQIVAATVMHKLGATEVTFSPDNATALLKTHEIGIKSHEAGGITVTLFPREDAETQAAVALVEKYRQAHPQLAEMWRKTQQEVRSSVQALTSVQALNPEDANQLSWARITVKQREALLDLYDTAARRSPGGFVSTWIAGDSLDNPRVLPALCLPKYGFVEGKTPAGRKGVTKYRLTELGAKMVAYIRSRG